MTDDATLGGLAAASGASFGTSGVRGLVSALTPQLCSAYAQAFLALAAGGERRLLIGHDLRPSSPAIAAGIGAAARSCGWDTIHAGVLPTPALAFAAQARGLAAVMVTGSHIPFDRNGIKFYTPAGEITKDDERQILAFPLGRVLPAGDAPAPDSADPSIMALYAGRYLDVFPADALRGLRVGVYEHSSVARDLLHHLLRALGAETVGLGRSEGFVAVDTEAVSAEDHALARRWSAEHGLDALVTTDGDADRPLLADETGDWLRGDILGLLCARALGAAAVVTPVSSTTAIEASGCFASVIRTRIGSPHVIAAMESAEAAPVAGFEANGGFLLGSEVALGGGVLAPLRTRDALLPILLVLAAARRVGRMSDLVRGLPSRCTHSDRLQSIDMAACTSLLSRAAQDVALLASLLAPELGPIARLDRTDGLRATFATGDIVHVRPSGNAPELRCYTEAPAARRAAELCRAALDRLRPLVTAPRR